MQRFSETILSSAGIAVIELGSGISFPSKEGTRILLPKGFDYKFYLINNGKQFIMGIKGKGLGNKVYHYFWGGEDDGAVFILWITQIAFGVFDALGEKGFYAYLKPRLITELEKEYPDSITLRQGIIWAFKIPGFSWDSLEKAKALELAGAFWDVSGKDQDVLRTNHFITGTYYEVQNPRGKILACGDGHFDVKSPAVVEISKMSLLGISEGTLTCEGYAPLVLDSGVYLIVKSEGLYE